VHSIVGVGMRRPFALGLCATCYTLKQQDDADKDSNQGNPTRRITWPHLGERSFSRIVGPPSLIARD
jgi:hypothetical protein